MPERIIDPAIDRFSEIARIASLIDERGFGESFFGNISVLDRAYSEKSGQRSFFLTEPHPDLIGSTISITRTGSTMQGIATDPLSNVGAYILGDGNVSLVEGAGPPSIELGAHLAIHSKLSLPTSAVIHCHIGELLPLLSGIDPLPDRIRTVRKLKEGSADLARSTAEVATQDVLVIWIGHGIVGISKTLSGALRIIDDAVDLAMHNVRRS